MINTLINSCNSENIDFKISAVKTFGLIFETLPKQEFSIEEINLMENIIIRLITSPNDDKLLLESLIAYEPFILYIKNKFYEREYFHSTLKILTSFCTLNNLKINEKIETYAIYRITEIIIIAYDFLDYQEFRNISEFFICLNRGNYEELSK